MKTIKIFGLLIAAMTANLGFASSSSSDEEESITLVSQEGDRLKALPRLVTDSTEFPFSELLKTMVGGDANEESSDSSSSEDDKEIPLPQVTTKVMAAVLEFCRARHGTYDNARPPFTPQEEKKFFEDHSDILLELLHAADFMDIQKLKKSLRAFIMTELLDPSLTVERAQALHSSSDEEESITLESQEGDRLKALPRFVTDSTEFPFSELLKTMVGGDANEESSDSSSSEDDKEIPLPQVTTEVLAAVLEFCRARHGTYDNARPPFTPQEEKKFFEDHSDILLELLHAADFMDIQKLKKSLRAFIMTELLDPSLTVERAQALQRGLLWETSDSSPPSTEKKCKLLLSEGQESFKALVAGLVRPSELAEEVSRSTVSPCVMPVKERILALWKLTGSSSNCLISADQNLKATACLDTLRANKSLSFCDIARGMRCEGFSPGEGESFSPLVKYLLAYLKSKHAGTNSPQANLELIRAIYAAKSLSEIHAVSKIHTALLEGADVNATDSNMGTPLHVASSHSNEYCVKILLIAGADVNAPATATDKDADADVNATDGDKSTPLHRAARCGSARVVKLLLKARADVNATDENKSTPLHLAANCFKSRRRRFPSSSYDCVKALLEAGADVNATDGDKSTPLHLAARRKNVGSVNLLLKAGADCNASTRPGETPFRFVIASCCKPKCDTHDSDTDSDTENCSDDMEEVISYLENHTAVSKIQALVRGYLARARACRAATKIQALRRGYLIRR